MGVRQVPAKAHTWLKNINRTGLHVGLY